MVDWAGKKEVITQKKTSKLLIADFFIFLFYLGFNIYIFIWIL